MTTPNFVVIDFNAESRQLLVRTLRRKFPDAVVHETDDTDKALAMARAVGAVAIVTHRTFDMPGAEVVQQLRNAEPSVVIVMVSGMDRETEALGAGADSFLPYDQWLRIGTVVDEHLKARAGKVSDPAPDVA